MSWFPSKWRDDLTPAAVVDHPETAAGNSWTPPLTAPGMSPSGESTMSASSWNDTVDDIKSRLNITLKYCEDLYANQTLTLTEQSPLGFFGFCPVVTDGLLCWPPTPLNETTHVKCFAELMSIRYDDTQNATRQCLSNGSWTKADYSNCKEIIQIPDAETQATIYFVGYILSLITLSIALGIFTYFKELRCLRNRIHMNLMWSYMLMYCMWILTPTALGTKGGASVACIFITTLLHYFHIATFFWMFVEGLYLYILVVETLTRENFKLRVYVCIGWGLPLLFIVIWIVVKSIIPIKSEAPSMCVWFNSHPIDWIFQAPTLAVLILNLAFLLAIMWVLITKLRSANTVETQQYHKAAKALLVLMPLLGVTYIIIIYAPTRDKDSENIFECIRAVLLSTQGFTVALFYCFLNTEVQNTVRHHFEMWKTRRSLGPSRLRSGSRSKDWSPRSRTESIRLYSQPTNIYHKRESCTSDVTTTTMVTVNGGSGATTKPTSNGTGSGGGGTGVGGTTTTSQRSSPFLHPPRQSYGGGGSV